MDSADRKYTVYMHTAPNGKRYIGITCNSVARRWGSTGWGYRRNQYFWKAINKYGWGNITHEVLATGLTEAEAKQSEIDLISTYKTRNPMYGYNFTDGGDGIRGYCYTAEARANISAAHMGVKPTAETRAKLSAVHMGNQNSLGYKHTEESKIKMAAAKKGNQNSLGYTHTKEARMNMSAAQKGRVVASETRAKISAAQTGNKNCLGYKHTEEARKNIRDAVNRRVKDVECLTRDGEVIGRYVSLTDAAEKTGVKMPNIWCACSGKSKTAGGYKWRYV